MDICLITCPILMPAVLTTVKVAVGTEGQTPRRTDRLILNF